MPIPAPATVRYERPAPDRIEVRVDTDSSGYLRVLEAFDEGWSVEVDGAPRDVVVADTFLMAVRLAPGSHAVRLEYRTPGARAGLIASGIAAALLALWGARLGGARYRVRAARL
jgi:uncharacterized membrane protein YfhO